MEICSQSITSDSSSSQRARLRNVNEYAMPSNNVVTQRRRKLRKISVTESFKVITPRRTFTERVLPTCKRSRGRVLEKKEELVAWWNREPPRRCVTLALGSREKWPLNVVQILDTLREKTRGTRIGWPGDRSPAVACPRHFIPAAIHALKEGLTDDCRWEMDHRVRTRCKIIYVTVLNLDRFVWILIVSAVMTAVRIFSTMESLGCCEGMLNDGVRANRVEDARCRFIFIFKLAVHACCVCVLQYN